MIRSLCRPETVPANFPSVFLNYAHQGFRVIAVAYKDMNMVYEPKATARRGTMTDDRKSNGVTAGTCIAETCVSMMDGALRLCMLCMLPGSSSPGLWDFLELEVDVQREAVHFLFVCVGH